MRFASGDQERSLGVGTAEGAGVKVDLISLYSMYEPHLRN